MEECKLVRLYKGASLFSSILFKTLPEKGDIITVRDEKFILTSHIVGFISEPGKLYAQIEPVGTSSFVGKKGHIPTTATKLRYLFTGAIVGYLLGMIVAGFIGGWYK